MGSGVNNLGGLGINFKSHDIVSWKNLNQYRLDYKTFSPKVGNDSYVPIGSVLDNKLFNLAEVCVLLLYVITILGKFIYLVHGNRRKRDELLETIDKFDISNKIENGKNSIRWYIQSLMEPSPASLLIDFLCMTFYFIASLLKTCYILTYLKILNDKVEYEYPYNSNNALEVGQMVVPNTIVFGQPTLRVGGHVMFNDDKHMNYKQTKENFVASGENRRFVAIYTSAAVLYGISTLLFLLFGMRLHRKDVMRVFGEGRLLPIKENRKVSDFNAAAEEDKGVPTRLVGFFDGLRKRVAGYKALKGDYEEDEEEDGYGDLVETKFRMEDEQKSGANRESGEAVDSLSTLEISRNYEMVNTYGENFTRLSPTYSKIYFSYGEPAFYGMGFLMFLQTFNAVCVLITNSDFGNTQLHITNTMVFGETALIVFLMALCVFIVLYTLVDKVFFGSSSMRIIYYIIFSVTIGTLLSFDPKHVNGVYVYVSVGICTLITFVCFLINTVTNTDIFMRHLDMDRLIHIRKQDIPKRISNVSRTVFKVSTE